MSHDEIVADDWRRFAPQIEAEASPLTELLVAADDTDALIAGVEDEIRRLRERSAPRPRQLAALFVLRDLILGGWDVRRTEAGLHVRPLGDHAEIGTKEAVRRQLLAGSADQFRVESVRRFVDEIEHPPVKSRDSIATLIASGPDLLKRMAPVLSASGEGRVDLLREACRPYICIAERGVNDPHTGIDLFDVWRYFRYTWTSRYRRSPGRHLPILIRDRAQPNHPVIAIAALSNAVVQLTARDTWAGWTLEGLQASIARGDISARAAVRALRDQVDADLQMLYSDDLGVDLANLAFDAEIDRSLLDKERQASQSRRSQLAEGVAAEKVDDVGRIDLVAAARTPLFVAKRAAAMRRLLSARALLSGPGNLDELIRTPSGQWAVELGLRQTKQRLISSGVMEITTCGAVPPYGPLLGGKLACLMMISPDVRSAYRARYCDEPSIIASQMAGRPIRREADLVLLCTSSLYPQRSSQYNRVRLPKEAAPGQLGEVRFVELGRTVGHGATNFGLDTEQALASLSESQRSFRNVNYVFGEGQSAKMRQTREGLEALGLDAADLIRHGAKRLIYGANLLTNAAAYLLGVEKKPRYACPESPDATESIAEFWRRRWLAPRLDNSEVLASVANHSPEQTLVSRNWREPLPIQRRLL